MRHVIHKDNFVVLRRSGESYLFFYDEEDAEAVIRTMARFAADPTLSFTWHDAAVLSRDVALPRGLEPLADSGRQVDSGTTADQDMLPDISSDSLSRY
jgi:hypothetical protein